MVLELRGFLKTIKNGLGIERIPKKRQNGAVGGTEILKVLELGLGSERVPKTTKNGLGGEKIPKKTPRKWSWKGGNA